MAISIALFGLGRHGVRYARHLARGDIPGAYLAGVWTRDRSKGVRIAQEAGAEPFEHAEDLVRAAFDAAIVAVPAGFHADLAPALAREKRPLLLEKPLAPTVHVATMIVEAFEFSNTPLMVAQTLRFDPLTQALRSEASQFDKLTGFGFEQRLEPRGLAWEDDPEVAGGGVILQTGIHTLDAVRFVTGADLAVLGAWGHRVGYQHQEDVAQVTLAARRAPPSVPVLGDVRVSKISQSRHMRFTLFYADGSVEADYIARDLVTTRGRERTRTRVAAEPTVVRATEAFVAHLNGGPNAVPGRDALASLTAVEQAQAMMKRPA